MQIQLYRRKIILPYKTVSLLCLMPVLFCACQPRDSNAQENKHQTSVKHSAQKNSAVATASIASAQESSQQVIQPSNNDDVAYASVANVKTQQADSVELTIEKLMLQDKEMQAIKQQRSLHNQADIKKETDNKKHHNNKLEQAESTKNVAQTKKITTSQTGFFQSYNKLNNIKQKHIPILWKSEQNASKAGKAVLKQARTMALEQQEIIKGACWDYLNAVFLRAGVQRKTIFKGKYPTGPFANSKDIQSGDWLYYVNHSYHDIQHSGMFVGWVDKPKKIALILSYAGEHRKEPARYKTYDISHVYNIMRPSLN